MRPDAEMRHEVISVASKPDVLAILHRQTSPLFAVLDAARDPRIQELLRASGVEHRSLFDGRRGDRLAAVAAYLTRLPSSSLLLNAVVDQGWGKSWGIFLSCERSFEAVRSHLRRLLVVETEDSQTLYFRFYDPRVLRPFLPSCTLDQRMRLFGPLEAVWMEARGGDALIRMQREGSSVVRRSSRGLFQIRGAQFEPLTREVLDIFVDRLMAHLRATGASARWSDDTLRQLVRCGIERAEQQGFLSERDISRFVIDMINIGH